MKVYAYLTTYIQGDLIAQIHKDVRWIGWSEIKDYDIVEEDKIIIEKYRNRQ